MGVLIYFRQLPRLLQVFWLLAFALLLAAIAILVVDLLNARTLFDALLSGPQAGPFPDMSPFMRLVFLGMALGMMGSACAWPGQVYMAHVRRPGRVRLWLASWQAQASAALALAALPLIVLALTLLLFSPAATPASMLFNSGLVVVVAAFNLIEAVVLIAAYVWALAINII